MSQPHNSVRNFGSILLVIIFILFAERSLAEDYPIPAAARMSEYLPLLKGKRVALLINQTSRVGNTLLADMLKKRGVNLVKIFVPEHGFRGTASAGAHINNSYDSATKLPIISLYGSNKKPKSSQLSDIDIVVYDLQDVGVRFFTYISTLEYAMEACAENGKKIIVLDRPNPNGMYVDGPILDTAFRSFVGMQRIPVVYGMTCGEYAQMLKGESWINKAKNLQLQVIKCSGWNHNSTYNLPVPPSPNLRTANAIALYPSICFFEGTVVSLGRGTDKPFEQWGHPAYEGKFTDTFRPESVVGARNPPMEGKLCYGKDLTLQKDTVYTLRLTWLIEAYKAFPQKDSFFNNFFEKLAGTNMLRSQIVEGKDENTIRRSWATGIQQFKAIRKKYLLYKDFE